MDRFPVTEALEEKFGSSTTIATKVGGTAYQRTS